MKTRLFIFYIFIVLGLIGIVKASSQSNAIIELNSDYSWNWVDGSPTPVVITTTPGPTQTPWIVTATPDDILTVTPTPEPTFTNTPEPGCLMQNQSGSLVRVRDKPSTSLGVHLGWIEPNQYIRPDAYYKDVTYTWFRIYWNEKQVGWTANFYTVLQGCGDLPYVNPFEKPGAVALLWHSVPGFNVNNVINSFSILTVKSMEFGLKTYADLHWCIDTLERGGICAYRSPNGDCPQNIGGSDPRQSAREFFEQNALYPCIALREYEKAYFEVVNECYFGGPESDKSLSVIYWWKDWTDEYLTLAKNYGCPKLIMLTFGPGHGYAEQYRIWKPELERLNAMGGLLGEHAYTPYHDDGLCACDPWLACRHRTNEQLRQAEGVDISIAITEAARGWGNDPVSVDDFLCYYDTIKHDDFVRFVALWLVGYNQSWPNANLDNYVVPIAERVAP